MSLPGIFLCFFRLSCRYKFRAVHQRVNQLDGVFRADHDAGSAVIALAGIHDYRMFSFLRGGIKDVALADGGTAVAADAFVRMVNDGTDAAGRLLQLEGCGSGSLCRGSSIFCQSFGFLITGASQPLALSFLRPFSQHFFFRVFFSRTSFRLFSSSI